MSVVGIHCDLIFSGNHLIVDRKILNKLFIPLTQIIRNAIIHGLCHKNGEKKLRIFGEIKENFLILLINNNGVEIDKEKLKEKLKEKNISVDEDKILDSIFLSGLSTKDTEDYMSGRGIGLDIVKNEIEKLNGKVTVYSEKDKGTVFKIMVPLN